MSASETISKQDNAIVKFAVLAAVVALVGLADAAYLTSKHFSGAQVPCSFTGGCEQVLTSNYAEVFGIPTAAIGAIAYFLVFSLAILTFFGNRKMWIVLGVMVTLMAVSSAWLIYLQAFVIGAFCQFCLLSAATSFTLLGIFLASKFLRTR